VYAIMKKARKTVMTKFVKMPHSDHCRLVSSNILGIE